MRFNVIKHQNKHIRTKREQEVGQIATAQLWKNKCQCKKKENTEGERKIGRGKDTEVGEEHTVN